MITGGWVKICGVRSPRDLEVALSSSPDAIGFICGVTHESEDALTVAEAIELSRQARLCFPEIGRVLVTHLEDAEAILALAAAMDAEIVQIHGLVSIQTVKDVYDRAPDRLIIVRAVHVDGPESVHRAIEVAPYCDWVLLDTRTSNRLGGTGETHDWTISRQIVQRLAGTPVILAGGLTANNVCEAISAVNPFGVDVNTGVDDACGDKSGVETRAFTRLVTMRFIPGEHDQA
ncbi:phosphoribosylanthranilate isomerase [Nocardia sp. NPDC058666]|uniref:phosphoribosylanthranilate isomerase n=1 Tax=Nocardia sp. NPDC058666 TaxID=3346587 RepID=UPI0036664349